MTQRLFTVEYTHPTVGVYYLADFHRSNQSDFTENKLEALPMTLDAASKAVARSVNPAKVISMSKLENEQAADYIALAESDQTFRPQAEFKAKWRDAIAGARESIEYFPPDWRLENPTRADTAVREKFAVRAAAVGLVPEAAWKETVDAAAYLYVAQSERNSARDLSSGFTQQDRLTLADTVAQFKADERDRIAFGTPPRTYYVAESLGLNPETTDLEVRAAARYVSLNKIENPGLTTGFDGQDKARAQEHAPARNTAPAPSKNIEREPATEKQHEADISAGFGY